ncbi:MAG: hypothetical protein KF752_16095 [Pirellulaceae bacterium]|nr:hypothetical protein [Pirellulaceae bacterium]
MQIPPAVQAAGVAVSVSRPTTDAPPQSHTSVAAEAHVEGSMASNQDRDAQGQGDGLSDGRRAPQRPAKSITDELAQPLQAAPTLPDEPPSQLDLVG